MELAIWILALALLVYVSLRFLLKKHRRKIERKALEYDEEYVREMYKHFKKAKETS